MNKVLKWSCGVIAAGLFLLLLVYFLRVSLIAPYLSRFVTETIESETGVKLQIEEISGNYFSTLALSGIKTVQANSAGPLVSLDLDSLSVGYSLLSLLSGADAFLGRLKLDVDGARISLLLKEDQLQSENADFIIPELPLVLPSIRIRNSAVAIKGGGEARTIFEGVSLVTQPGLSGATLLKLAVADWSWQHPALQERKVDLSAEAIITRKGVRIENLTLGNGLLVASADIDLQQAPKAFPYVLEARIFEGHISLAGKWTENGVELQTHAQGVDLAELPSLVKLPFSALGGILDLNAEADLDPASLAAAAGRLQLTISEGRIGDMAIERIDLNGSLRDELLTIEDMVVRAAGSKLELNGAQGPWPMLLAGEFTNLIDRIAGSFSIQSDNLPAILMAFAPPSDRVPTVPDHAMVLQGQFDEGTLVVTEGHLTAAAGSVSLGPLQVQIPTAERPWYQSKVRCRGTLDISTLQPIGVLFGLPEMEGSLKASIDLSGSLGAPEGHAAIDGKQIAWRNIMAEKVSLSASGDEKRLTVDAFEIQRGRDRVTGRGSYNWSTAGIEESRLDLDLADFHPYLEMLAPAIGWVDPGQTRISGRLKGRILLSGPASLPDGVADFEISGLEFQNRAFGHAIFNVSKQGDRISSKAARLENGKDIISIEGSVDLASKSATALSLSVRIADIGQYTRDLVPPQWNAAGTVNIDVQASGPLLQPVARLEGDFKQLQVGQIEIAAATVRTHSDGRLIQVDLAEVKGPRGHLKLSGRVQNNWGQGSLVFDIDACDVQFEDLDLALPQPARVAYAQSGSISFADMILDGPGGRVAIDGILAQTGASDLRVGIANLTGAKWFEALAGDRLHFKGLDAEIRLTGNMARPNMAATGRAGSISIRDYPNPLSAKFDLSYAQKHVTVQRLAVRGDPGPDLSMTGRFPVQVLPEFVLMPGAIEAAGNFSVPDLKLINAFMSGVRIKSGELQGEFQFGGSWRQLDGRLLFEGRNVDVDTDWQPLPPGPYLFDGDLNIDGSRLRIKSLQLKGPGLTFAGQGNWSKIPSPADLMKKTRLDPAGELALEGKLTIPDMGWLSRGVSSLRRTSGKLEADLRLAGPVAKPDYQATVRISDGALQTNSGMPPLRAIDLSARLDALGLQLDRLEALMGGSPVKASGTCLWKTSDPKAIALKLRGTNLLLYRNEGILMRADTDLKLEGPLERMVLSGEIAVTKGLVKQNLNIFGQLKGAGGPQAGSGLELFTLPEPPLRDLRFDVRLTSRSPIDIRGNIAQGSARPDLHLGGTGLLPVLTGKIYTDTTRVSLPAGRLTINSGVIQFLETDPEMPILELNGRSRMLGYDISVQIEGPYNEPEITLSSVPPLPGDDLMLLLLTGQAPKGTLGKAGRQRQNIQVAVYVAKDMFGSLFSKDSPEEIDEILDRFDFQIGRDVTSSGDETIEAQFRVADGLILKRDQLFITGEKDAYDYVNTGVKLVFRFK